MSVKRRKMMKRLLLLAVVVCVVLVFSGCTTVQKGAAVGGVAGAAVGGVWGNEAGVLSAAEGALTGAAAGGLLGALIGDQLEDRTDANLEAEIENLNDQIASLEDALAKSKKAKDRGGEQDQIIDGLKHLTDKQATDLDYLKKRLKEKEDALERQQKLTLQKASNMDDLKQQLDELQIQLAQTPKGITLTMVDSLLFEKGMAEITDKGKKLLDNVAVILNNQFPGREFIIEGHTDNIPIKMSGWKTNWELGAARALSVLHYLSDSHDFDPKKLSASSYGQFHPVASNDTEESRAMNRRAVIVVPPTLDVTKKSFTD
jgi:chemotaxis protein MotB